MKTHSLPLICIWTVFVILLIPSLKLWHMLTICIIVWVFKKTLWKLYFWELQQVCTSLGGHSTRSCEGRSPEHSTQDQAVGAGSRKGIKKESWHAIGNCFFQKQLAPVWTTIYILNVCRNPESSLGLYLSSAPPWYPTGSKPLHSAVFSLIIFSHLFLYQSPCPLLSA